MVFEPIFQSALRGGKTKFVDVFSKWHPQLKGLQGQEFSGPILYSNLLYNGSLLPGHTVPECANLFVADAPMKNQKI